MPWPQGTRRRSDTIRPMFGGGSIQLARVFGVRIGVDYSWFIVLFLIIWNLSGYYEDVAPESSAFALAVASALLFFLSILLHELGHAWVALRNGIPIEGIDLWMFGGVAKLGRDAGSPGVEFRIAIAGPLVTLVIAAVCFGLSAAVSSGSDALQSAQFDEDVTGATTSVLGYLTSINVLLLVFNLIPAFPLDGGRITRAIAWKVTGDRNRATRGAARLGQGFSYLFIALGIVAFFSGNLIDGIWLALIGFILLQSARGAVIQTEFTSRIEGLRVADVMDDEPVAIPENASVERALDEFFLRYRWPWFPVVDPAQRFLGLIERGAADAVPEVSRTSSTVRDVFEADSTGTLRVRDDAPLESLLGNDALGRLGALMAVDADGRLRGVVTADEVSRVLRRALSGGAGGTPQSPPTA